MQEYRFVFTEQAAMQNSNGLPEQAPANNGLPETKNSKTFAEGFSHRVATSATQAVLSPLNSATGGLATPLFNVGKAALTGAGAGAIGGAAVGLAIAAVSLVVQKLDERVKKMEAKANQLNERDNLLILAGVKGFSTTYTGSISGVNSTNNH